MSTEKSFELKKMSPQLIASATDCSLEFYTNKLGFELDFRYEGFHAGIMKDRCFIHIKAAKRLIGEKENGNNDHLEILFVICGLAMWRQ